MRSLLLMAAAILFVACESAPRDASALVRDSAGIVVVTSPALVGEIPEWTLEEGAVPVVGTDEAPLYRVVGAARTSEGGTVVGNGGSREIFWFDAAGALSEIAGGQGQGPGEYSAIQSLVAIPGDSIVVTDLLSSRVDLYGPDHTIARSWTIGELGRFNQPAPVARLGDQTFVAITQGTDDPYPGRQRYTGFAVRYDDGTPLDTLASFPGDEGYTVYCGPDETAVCNIGVIYGPRLSVAVAEARIVAGVGNEIRIYEEGRLARILRVADALRAVTPEAVAAFLDSLTAGGDPEIVRRTRDRFADAPRGAFLPRFVDVALDAAGRIWTARGDVGPGANRWDVFSPSGERVAVVTLPPRSKIWEIGHEHVLISQTDALDVETVRLLDIVRTR